MDPPDGHRRDAGIDQVTLHGLGRWRPAPDPVAVLFLDAGWPAEPVRAREEALEQRRTSPAITTVRRAHEADGAGKKGSQTDQEYDFHGGRPSMRRIDRRPMTGQVDRDPSLHPPSSRARANARAEARAGGALAVLLGGPR